MHPAVFLFGGWFSYFSCILVHLCTSLLLIKPPFVISPATLCLSLLFRLFCLYYLHCLYMYCLYHLYCLHSYVAGKPLQYFYRNLYLQEHGMFKELPADLGFGAYVQNPEAPVELAVLPDGAGFVKQGVEYRWVY